MNADFINKRHRLFTLKMNIFPYQTHRLGTGDFIFHWYKLQMGMQLSSKILFDRTFISYGLFEAKNPAFIYAQSCTTISTQP